jgi:glycerate kinase
MIRDALDKGFRDISIAIGGSATNDGGMGCARALGVRFLDAQGNELQGTGSDLEKVAEIDVSGLDPRISETKITVMCDVTNPLTGKDGATYTFGAQKGATPEIQARLEAGMCSYRDVIRRQFGVDPDAVSGAGAAGAGCCWILWTGSEGAGSGTWGFRES